jgi:hypothetical protein
MDCKGLSESEGEPNDSSPRELRVLPTIKARNTMATRKPKRRIMLRAEHPFFSVIAGLLMTIQIGLQDDSGCQGVDSFSAFFLT